MALSYVDFIASGEDAYASMCSLFAAVHGFNAKAAPGARLAVAFPLARLAVVQETDDRSQRPSAPSCGPLLRVFGAADALRAFAKSKLPARLTALGAVSAQPVAEVPAGHGWVRYVRDRRFERQTPTMRAKRQQRRAARGITRVAEAGSAQHLKGGSFGLLVRSQTTGHEYYVDVRREPAQPAAVFNPSALNAYGLSSSPDCAVPSFG